MQIQQNTILGLHGNVRPWTSDWSGLPKEFHRITNLFVDWFARKNHKRYRDRDSSLTFNKCRRQATNGFFAEIYTYFVLYDPNDASTADLIPRWYSAVMHMESNDPNDYESIWDSQRVSWDADHSTGHIQIEDKCKEQRDPGVALQWSSTRGRTQSNRLPVFNGAVGPNYYMCLLDHRTHCGTHEYRILAIFRGIDMYYKYRANFSYEGTPLVGKMQNRNKHKRSLNIRTLSHSGINFYCPKRFAPRTPLERPIFTENDFPKLA